MYIQAHILVFLLLSDCGTAWFSGSGGRCVKQWFWVPLVLGSLSALVFYYVFVRRRQSFRIYKTLSDALLNCCIVAAEYYMRFIIYDLC